MAIRKIIVTEDILLSLLQSKDIPGSPFCMIIILRPYTESY